MSHSGCQLCGFEEASKSATSEKENAAPSTSGTGASHSRCNHESGGKVVFISGSLHQSGPDQKRSSTPRPGKPFRTRVTLSENVGGGYSPSYAWGYSRLQRVAKEREERHLIQDAIQELQTTNGALLQEVTELQTSSHERITALKDHLAHTEAQLAAEKERSFSSYQALQAAKDSLERDRDARQTAIKRAAAALTKLDQEEAHWRHVDSVNKSLKSDLEKARARLEELAGLEKEKALLEERLGGERQRRERAEGAVQGLEGEKERMKAELERFKGLEVGLREGEEMRDGLQIALTAAREDLANSRKSAHVAGEQASTLQSENSRLRGDLARAETLLKGERVRTGELEHLLERVLRKRADIEQENRVLIKELEAAKVKAAQADARIEQLTGQREEAKRRAEECAQRLEDARAEAQSLAQLLSSAEGELRALDQECAQLARWEEAAEEAQRQLSTTKRTLEDVGTRLRFESNARSGLERENEALRQENRNLDGSLKSANEAATEGERKLRDCREELRSARAEIEGVKRAVEWAERRADEAKRAADVAAERVKSEQLTVQKLSAEVEAWRSGHVALEAEVSGHVSEREQQLEVAVRREVGMREEFEERERRLVAKVEGREKDLLEAREKAQNETHDRANCRAELDRCLEKVRVLEAQARDAQEALRRAVRAREEAEGCASKVGAEAAAARKKATTLKKENAAMMANYDAWLRTLVKNSRQARPHNIKQASAIPEYEPFPLFHPIRTDHDREELARCSSPERDRPTKDYLAARRACRRTGHPPEYTLESTTAATAAKTDVNYGQFQMY